MCRSRLTIPAGCWSVPATICNMTTGSFRRAASRPAKQLLMPRVASFMKKRRSGRFSLLRPWKKACVILFPTSFWKKEKNAEFTIRVRIWSLFRFVGEESEINLDTAEPEFRKYEWVTLDEAVKRAVDFKKDAYKKMAAAFKPFIG